MKKLAIIAIFIVALAFGGFLGFIITGFATAGTTQDSFEFYYEPSSPDPIEELFMNVDVGGVEIQYNNSNTPYYAKIEVSIVVSGLFMAGRNYLDFFEPYTEWWDNSSDPVSFDMNVKPDVWFDPSHWFKSYNIDIKVTLRTDVIYNVFANVATGSLKMRVPENIVLNNTVLRTSTGSVLLSSSSNTNFQGIVLVQSSTGKANVSSKESNYAYGLVSGTSTGSLILNFENCIMSNDIKGTVSTGSITYNTDNLTFTKDSSIVLQTTTGSIGGVINQYEDLGANVSAIFGVTTGGIDLVYINDKSNIGTKFTSTFTTGGINYDYSGLEFFQVDGILTSGNYNTAPYRYMFTLSTVTGNINVDAESHHL